MKRNRSLYLSDWVDAQLAQTHSRSSYVSAAVTQRHEDMLAAFTYLKKAGITTKEILAACKTLGITDISIANVRIFVERLDISGFSDVLIDQLMGDSFLAVQLMLITREYTTGNKLCIAALEA